MIDVVLNGRFLGQRMTGVQRFAREITMALDELIGLPEWKGARVRLAVPRSVRVTLPLRHVEVERVGRLGGNAWEQLDLLRHRPGNLLVNLGSTAPLLRRRQIVTLHDMSVYANEGNFSRAFRAWYRFLQPRIARSASRVVTVSKFSADEIVKYCGIDPGKIVCVHNGADHLDRVVADPRVFSRLNVEPGGYMLAIGNLSPNKNIRAVVEASALLRRTGHDIDLIVVGTQQAVFAEGADPAGSEEVAIRAGYVTDEELRALYERAVVLAFPSLYEGWGIPVIEAMKFGCPVVASNTSVLPETSGNAALLCDPRDPSAMAALITDLIEDERLADRLRERGRRRADRFTWRRSAETLLREMASTVQRTQAV